MQILGPHLQKSEVKGPELRPGNLLFAEGSWPLVSDMRSSVLLDWHRLQPPLSPNSGNKLLCLAVVVVLVWRTQWPGRACR